MKLGMNTDVRIRDQMKIQNFDKIKDFWNTFMTSSVKEYNKGYRVISTLVLDVPHRYPYPYRYMLSFADNSVIAIEHVRQSDWLLHYWSPFMYSPNKDSDYSARLSTSLLSDKTAFVMYALNVHIKMN